MRELKFRAWNTEIMQFEYFELHNITVPDRLLCQYKYPVQQYTGLKDKNGVEIYEGDILIFRPSYDESLGGQFGNAVFSASFKDGSFRFGDEFADQDGANYYEIIGNIFENSELLEA